MEDRGSWGGYTRQVVRLVIFIDNGGAMCGTTIDSTFCTHTTYKLTEAGFNRNCTGIILRRGRVSQSGLYFLNNLQHFWLKS